MATIKQEDINFTKVNDDKVFGSIGKYSNADNGIVA